MSTLTLWAGQTLAFSPNWAAHLWHHCVKCNPKLDWPYNSMMHQSVNVLGETADAVRVCTAHISGFLVFSTEAIIRHRVQELIRLYTDKEDKHTSWKNEDGQNNGNKCDRQAVWASCKALAVNQKIQTSNSWLLPAEPLHMSVLYIRVEDDARTGAGRCGIQVPDFPPLAICCPPPFHFFATKTSIKLASRFFFFFFFKLLL